MRQSHAYLEVAMIGRFDLTDWEWTIIEPLLPGRAEKKARGRGGMIGGF
jgi:hypothetical protein